MRWIEKSASFLTVLTFAVATVAPLSAGAQGFLKNFEKQVEQAKQQAQQAAQQVERTAQRQSSQQQSNQPQAQPARSQPAATVASADPATAPIPYSACCTPAAMDKYAKRASFLDIVGIKLGMTPKEAFAAVHTFDPKLKIVTIKSKMEVPGIPESQYPWILRGAVVYKAAPPSKSVPNFLLRDGTPVYSYSPEGGSDIILIDFTTPPNPPLAARITRTVSFPQGHPVFASTLLAALRKKYGHENVPDHSGAYVEWLYGPDSKLLQRQLTDRERICKGGPGGAGVGFQLPNSLGGRIIVNTLMWDKYAKGRFYSPGSGNGYPADGEWDVGEAIPVCIPFSTAGASLIYTSPNSQNTDLTVSIESPALWYASYRSTQEWMEAKAEAAKRKEEQAVKKNAAPQL